MMGDETIRDAMGTEEWVHPVNQELIADCEVVERRAMDIFEVTENKKRFLPLLLLGDEQESMVDRYLERGRMYVLDDGEVRAECVVTDEGKGVLEIRNIAVTPECQGKGYGRALIDFLVERYRGRFSVLRACTGESPLTVPFYERCGFS